MKHLIVTVALLLCACGSGPEVMQTPLPTPQGPVLGEVTENGMLNFKGVPFAAAPVGDLRFRPPAPAPSWTQTRTATAFSPQCLQNQDTSGGLAKKLIDGHGLSAPKRWLFTRIANRATSAKISEDCLYLNVRTPDVDGSLPVMVWIHGGGHQFGSGDFDWYQGDDLPARGVVLVTINYRLGLAGFLAHPALSAEAGQNGPRESGNYGLMDQIAALQWVRDNISAYGGDPERVTIFGESAGASSVMQIMSAPPAEGLFHRAIAQSPAAARIFTHLTENSPTGASAENLGRAYFERAGIDIASADDLRALPADALLGAASLDDERFLQPVAGTSVMPLPVPVAFATGAHIQVPSIFGYNSDEGTIFYESVASASTWAPDIDPDDPLPALRAGYGDETGQTLYDLYGFGEDVERAALDLMGDETFGTSVTLGLEATSPAWAYAFTRVPPSPRQTLGAFHTAEIPFVFGTHTPALGLSEADRALTRQMQGYWVRFAETGDPNGPGLSDWPQYGDDGMWRILSANTDTVPSALRRYRPKKRSALNAAIARNIAELTSP